MTHDALWLFLLNSLNDGESFFLFSFPSHRTHSRKRKLESCPSTLFPWLIPISCFVCRWLKLEKLWTLNKLSIFDIFQKISAYDKAKMDFWVEKGSLVLMTMSTWRHLTFDVDPEKIYRKKVIRTGKLIALINKLSRYTYTNLPRLPVLFLSRYQNWRDKTIDFRWQQLKRGNKSSLPLVRQTSMRRSSLSPSRSAIFLSQRLSSSVTGRHQVRPSRLQDKLWHTLTMSHRNNECRIYVGNLPADVRTKDIEDLFYKFGKINYIDLKNRRGPPFAFVEFDDPR